MRPAGIRGRRRRRLANRSGCPRGGGALERGLRLGVVGCLRLAVAAGLRKRGRVGSKAEDDGVRRSLNLDDDVDKDAGHAALPAKTLG